MPVTHVADNRKKLLLRVNRLIGQLAALKKEIEVASTDEECRSVMQQLSSIRGAMNGLVLLYLEEHTRKHVSGGRTAREREEAAEDLLAALKSFRA